MSEKPLRKKILNIKYKKVNIKDGCAINCVSMVLSYYGKEFDFKKFLKNVSCRDRGYDLLEIITQLKKMDIDIEFGFWDEEIIGKKNIKNDAITQDDIKNNDDILENLREDHKNMVEFISKNQEIINFKRPSLRTIKKYIDIDTPVIIHVDISKYHDKVDDSIHSVLVAGYDKKRIYLVDPILGRIHKPIKQVLNAWKYGGKYYLVIKK